MKRRIPSLRLSVLGAWLMLAGLAIPSRGDTALSREFVVKAAFLYNFSQFTQWPDDAFASSDAPFVIGIAGDDPFGGALEQAVRDKKAGGHPIVVEHCRDAAALRACHILYVSASEADNTDDILKKVGDTTLTVGDSDGFTARGGAFRFLLEDKRVRFEVNIDVVKELRLKISAKLLKLARIYGK